MITQLNLLKIHGIRQLQGIHENVNEHFIAVIAMLYKGRFVLTYPIIIFFIMFLYLLQCHLEYFSKKKRKFITKQVLGPYI